MIRQPFLHQSTLSQMKLRASLSSPSCVLMSPLQASALKAAYSFTNEENDSEADDLEDLSFDSSKPLMMKRNVQLDLYVSDYEFDEDDDSYLEDCEIEDDLCSVDSEVTLPVSNKAHCCYGKLSPTSSTTNSTTTDLSSDCSISSVASFDSEVAVSKHHRPTAIYHHHRHASPQVALSPPSAKKKTRHSLSTTQTSSSSSKSSAKKPFVRPDLMPSPLKSQSLSLTPDSPPTPRRKSLTTTGRRLVRNSSSRSMTSVQTI